MTTGTDVSIRDAVAGMIDRVVDGVAGVSGALIASADGFVIATRLPGDLPLDAAALAAMSAATLGLSSRLVGVIAGAPIDIVVQRSGESQVFVFAIGSAAVLTVLADGSADSQRIERIGREVASGLRGAFVAPA